LSKHFCFYIQNKKHDTSWIKTESQARNFIDYFVERYQYVTLFIGYIKNDIRKYRRTILYSNQKMWERIYDYILMCHDTAKKGSGEKTKYIEYITYLAMQSKIFPLYFNCGNKFKNLFCSIILGTQQYFLRHNCS
jgi:hypothetical protein